MVVKHGLKKNWNMDKKNTENNLWGKKSSDIWLRRTNQLDEIHNDVSLLGIEKGQRARWMGYMLCMKDQRTPKRLIYSRLG